jgi:hypothetical protein
MILKAMMKPVVFEVMQVPPSASGPLLSQFDTPSFNPFKREPGEWLLKAPEGDVTCLSDEVFKAAFDIIP